MLGLAVVAAAAMAAFAGGGTASATVLCKVHPEVVVELQGEELKEVEVCPKEQKVLPGEWIETVNKGNTLFKNQTTGAVQFECEESQLKGQLKETEQPEGQSKPESSFFKKCIAPGLGAMTIELLNQPWRVWVTWTGQGPGQAETNPETVGRGEIHVEKQPGAEKEAEWKLTVAGVSCTYRQKEESIPLQGITINGEEAPHEQRSQIHFEQEGSKAQFTKSSGGFLCPASGKFVAQYWVYRQETQESALENVYVAKRME
jgi:hypothetical protein